MATRKLGKAGNGVFNGTTIQVNSHNYDGTNDVQEVTTVGSNGSTEYIAGYNDRSASMEFFVDFDNPETDLVKEGDTGTLTLKLADTAKTISGSAIVKNVKITNAAKTVVTMTGDFQFSGAVTRS